jgi:hypothetical protein
VWGEKRVGDVGDAALVLERAQVPIRPALQEPLLQRGGLEAIHCHERPFAESLPGSSGRGYRELSNSSHANVAPL